MTTETGVLSTRLGLDLLEVRPLHGGDLSEVHLLELADGTRRVLKRGPAVATEGRMLQAMAAAGAPVPEVLALDDGLLQLSYLPETRPGPGAWHALGRALAAMHAAGARAATDTPPRSAGPGPGPDAPNRARSHAAPGQRYGWDEAYAFGRVRIPGQARPEADWPTFWAEARLMESSAELPPDLARRVEALARALPDRLPATPPPALLHGDLWGGNLLFGPGTDGAGTVHLIDPACCHGDAEVDLAMLTLFGRPSPGFAEGYGPLFPGWEARRPIYQLWPALVHLRLFGGGYRGMVEELLRDCGA